MRWERISLLFHYHLWRMYKDHGCFVETGSSFNLEEWLVALGFFMTCSLPPALPRGKTKPHSLERVGVIISCCCGYHHSGSLLPLWWWWRCTFLCHTIVDIRTASFLCCLFYCKVWVNRPLCLVLCWLYTISKFGKYVKSVWIKLFLKNFILLYIAKFGALYICLNLLDKWLFLWYNCAI